MKILPSKKNIKVTVTPANKMNDVFTPDFVSKMDQFFTLKAKEKDHWQRKSSIKLFGQWT